MHRGATVEGSRYQERWRQTKAPSKLKLQMYIKYSFLRRGREIGSKIVISRIYKRRSKLKYNTGSNSIKKWTKSMKRYFTKEDTQMTNKHMKDVIISH